MERRNFIKNAAASGIAMAGLGSFMGASASESTVSNTAKFKLKYAPHLGMFPELAGKDPIDNIRFIADQGFRAIFDNGLMNKPTELQEKIAGELARQGMDIGPFVLYADFSAESMVLFNDESRKMLKEKLQQGIETYKRTGAKYALMVPGRYNQKLEWGYQTANVIDSLRELSEMAEKEGMVIVLEPLNRWNHPGLFLTGMPQAYAICRAVNSPSCKIVDDMYHQQITEGNIIPNIDSSWSEIGAFHIGDNPGRKEPTTGEINYKNVFQHIYNKGYDGVLCCEHGKSKSGKEGELAFIKAYREVDSFEI
ncbi:hydroxypyruvate isomerase [Mariniphaga anaerophila]|uniref:Hydroxypyruvate isomerase n=1 Tax=Mariniphaga anaerophila TaxID=1484053 RepID=A0A1M5CZB5_9BACT|nr:TIM barrel protein [Mariniphaga anaerophila]SHF59987.1 hydroxypyruvate isomerase [Mariniphaga anaerophila]